MTLPPIKSYQDIDRERIVYRDIDDPYNEQGLISVLFLSCSKHHITKHCFLSSVKALSNLDLEWCLCEQGWDIDYQQSFNTMQLFLDVELNRKIVICPDKNYGIATAFNDLFRMARGEYCLVLENDFLCKRIDNLWLLKAKAILDEYPKIGIVHLRSIDDPQENWGWGKEVYNIWSIRNHSEVKTCEIDVNGWKSNFLFTEMPINGITNNPCLVRKSMREELGYDKEVELWCDLRHSEQDLQRKYLKSGWHTAHISDNVYYHVGPRPWVFGPEGDY